MSDINIKGLISNIKQNTNAYHPIIEVIANCIWAIEQKEESDGKILITFIRSSQQELGNALSEIKSIKFTDDGIGFNEQNRNSFNTLYSDQNIKIGGKGFGRFICLKYFNSVTVDSIFQEGNTFQRRSFSMGKEKNIIINEKISSSTSNKTGTTIILDDLVTKFPDKKLSTIANNILEKILPYFITENYKCPQIILTEENTNNKIILNEYKDIDVLSNIKEVEFSNEFELFGKNNNEKFIARIFKIYSPNNQYSKISLVAHKRVVKETNLKDYINEFEGEFCETTSEQETPKNYIIKIYVFGNYLDENVDLERNDFKFHKNNDLINGISQTDIEKEASDIAKLAFNSDVKHRREKKAEKVNNYINQEAPWFKNIANKLDFSQISCNPSYEEINTICGKYQYLQQIKIKQDVDNILSGSDKYDINKVNEILNSTTEMNKANLVHYVAYRRMILDLLDRNLEQNDDGKYSREAELHDIIFPRNRDTDEINYNNHNLWIIDEKLNFSDYVCSDKALSDKNPKRPDLLVYNKPIVFREENKINSPVTIFEFKRPQRDDFANPASDEDPVTQIIEYILCLKDGKYKTPNGRKINIDKNTPCYGYIICDINPKIEKWLQYEKNFKRLLCNDNWFYYHDNLCLRMEFKSWDELLRDAKMHNSIFFKKLGIQD